MSIFKNLFSTDYGLMSLGVLLFILVMAGFFIRFFTTKMREDEARMLEQKH